MRVRETIPDAVLGRADEVVLVDLTPEALLDRLRAGKVYRPERIDAALNNFFRIENLSALREVALRQVAQEVGQKRLATVEPVGTRDETIAGEHAAGGRRATARTRRALPRRTAASTTRLAIGAAARRSTVDLLWVRPPGPTLGGAASDRCGRCGISRRFSARGCSSRSQTTCRRRSPRSPAEQRHDLHPDRPQPPRRAVSPGCAPRSPSG